MSQVRSLNASERRCDYLEPELDWDGIGQVLRARMLERVHVRALRSLAYRLAGERERERRIADTLTRRAPRT